MLRPLGNRVLVRPEVSAPLKSESGIEIVGGYDPPAVMGTVVAIGDTRCPCCQAARPCPVSVYDVVLFAPSAGEAITVDGDEYLTLREADILAVIY